MIGALGKGMLTIADGPEMPSVDDFLPDPFVFQGTPFAINRIILVRILATVIMLLVLGITASRAKLIPSRWQGAVEWLIEFVGGCWAAPSGHDVRFEDAAGRWVYEGQLRADTVRHGVIPDRSNHQERHEILRVESFDGDVKAVQSFLNEHDAGYIAEVTPEQPIIVEALGNKACVYVTKIVQCELRDVLRLLEAK